MAKLKEIFQWQTLSGQAVTAGDFSITPQSQALTVRWPGRWPGGFIWNRPIAVLVERDGDTERIPIVYVTRMAQIGLFGLAFSIIILALSIKTRRSK